MKSASEETVGGMAALRPEAIPVFERYGIDYCCGGEDRLEVACRRRGVDPAVLVREIDERSRGETTARFRPEKKTITELIAHIVGHHHAFTRRELERLQPLGRKVVEMHGANHPELADVVTVLEELVHDLTPHMLKEETVLFPYLRKLDGIGTFSARLPDSPFGPVGNPIRMMKREHEQAGDLLARLSELTDAYTIPEDACPSYQSFYTGLQGLESDLHEHIHIENNVLFPEAEFAEGQARRR